MPNIKSAIKRVKVNESNRIENKKVRKIYKDSIKEFELAVSNNDKNVEDLFKKAVSNIDKAWSKGVLKRNTADRKKARLSIILNKKA